MHFIKMHGIGNDYIYVDEFLYKAPADIGDAARLASDRHTGIGGDGLILIQPSQIADCKMRMFNADGSEGRMCGNAIRCIARYMLERHPEICPGDTVRIETLSGIKIVTAQRDAEGKPSMLRADMGAPGLSPESIPVLTAAPQDLSIEVPGFSGSGVCVSMGSPHIVFFIDSDPSELDIAHIGPAIESHSLFPERVNVEFVQMQPDGSLKMRVWERGSGETMACGTGACASVVAAVENGYFQKGEAVQVHLKGGDLTICYSDEQVVMQGPATEVFEGVIQL